MERRDVTDAPSESLVPLQRLAAIVVELGAERLHADAQALAERIAEGRFNVACVGQFKRGKSTLLNALVGQSVLPAGIVPITTVPTTLRYGAYAVARVRLAREGWREIELRALESYVSEELNPENEKRVDAVEVFVPSPLLQDGLCLVDTPGIGSVFQGNTSATRAFVPHIDAAIAVIGADPPLSGEELTLIEEVARQIPDIIVVLNKADRFADAERQQAVTFAERMLSGRVQRAIGPVLQVSATDRLAGTGPTRDWDRLIERLDGLVAQSGRALLHAALERGVARLIRQTLREIEEARDALMRPLDESERRLDALRQCVGDVAHRSLQLGFLLAAEQEQLSKAFASRREKFLEGIVPAATEELNSAIASAAMRAGPALRRRAIRLAQEVARRRVEPWLAEEQRAAEEMYRRTADRFVALANEFLERLAASGEPALGHLPRALESESGFRTASRFYFRELHPLVYSSSPLRWVLDVIIPGGRARRAIHRDAARYLEQLLGMNSTLVQNDLDERVMESRRRLEGEIRALLQDVYTSAERALARSRATQAAGEQAVRGELLRLDRLARAVRALAPHRAVRSTG